MLPQLAGLDVNRIDHSAVISQQHLEASSSQDIAGVSTAELNSYFELKWLSSVHTLHYYTREDELAVDHELVLDISFNPITVRSLCEREAILFVNIASLDIRRGIIASK